MAKLQILRNKQPLKSIFYRNEWWITLRMDRRDYFFVQTIPPSSDVVILLPLIENVVVQGELELAHQIVSLLPSTLYVPESVSLIVV